MKTLFFFILLATTLAGCSLKETKKESKMASQTEQPNQRADQKGPAKNCVEWFDGCNSCEVKDGKILSCTEIACFTMESPKCEKYKK